MSTEAAAGGRPGSTEQAAGEQAAAVEQEPAGEQAPAEPGAARAHADAPGTADESGAASAADAGDEDGESAPGGPDDEADAGDADDVALDEEDPAGPGDAAADAADGQDLDAAGPYDDEEDDGDPPPEPVRQAEPVDLDESAARPRRRSRILLTLGFVVAALVIIGAAAAVISSVTHGFTKPVKVTYKDSALFSLKTGECFNPNGQSYTLIPCSSPHVAEVYGTFALPAGAWPGSTAVAADAQSGCSGLLSGYLNPQLAISLGSYYVYPDATAWQAGTRTVICEVRATSGDITGSVKGASATAG